MTVGNGEWYLHLEQDVHGDLREQVEYAQRNTQTVVEGDALVLCEGANGGLYLVPHVNEGSFHLLEEGSQLLVILQLVIIHHLMHLLPRGICFGAEAARRGLTFCCHDVIP